MATEIWTSDNLIAGDNVRPVSETGTLLSGENVVRGALLGKVTASGKLVLSLAASVDGSEVPYGIASDDVDATAADQAVGVYIAGEFNENAMTFGTGHDFASTKDGLRDIGIYLKETVNV